MHATCYSIPAWNRRAFVLEAIQSILDQSHTAVDIHIFDNAPTDGTPAAVQAEFGGQVALHLNAQNVGYVGNVNRCLSLESNYDWIAILHPHDMYLDHSLARIFTAIEINASAGIIFGQQVSFDGNDQSGNSNVCEVILHKGGNRAVRRAQFQLPCSSTAYSALAIRKNGGFTTDYPYSADEEHNARVASQFDIVSLYFLIVSRIEIVASNGFNIGGGMQVSLSLLELFTMLKDIIGAQPIYDRLSSRVSDQKVFVAGIAGASRLFGWQPTVSSRDGVEIMMEWARRIK